MKINSLIILIFYFCILLESCKSYNKIGNECDCKFKMNEVKVKRIFINDSTIKEIRNNYVMGEHIFKNGKWYFKGADTLNVLFDTSMHDTSITKFSYYRGRQPVKFIDESKYLSNSEIQYINEDKVILVIEKITLVSIKDNKVFGKDIILRYYNQRKGIIMEMNLDTLSKNFGHFEIMNSYFESRCYRKKMNKLLAPN